MSQICNNFPIDGHLYVSILAPQSYNDKDQQISLNTDLRRLMIILTGVLFLEIHLLGERVICSLIDFIKLFSTMYQLTFSPSIWRMILQVFLQ